MPLHVDQKYLVDSIYLFDLESPRMHDVSWDLLTSQTNAT